MQAYKRIPPHANLYSETVGANLRGRPKIVAVDIMDCGAW